MILWTLFVTPLAQHGKLDQTNAFSYYVGVGSTQQMLVLEQRSTKGKYVLVLLIILYIWGELGRAVQTSTEVHRLCLSGQSCPVWTKLGTLWLCVALSRTVQNKGICWWSNKPMTLLQAQLIGVIFLIGMIPCLVAISMAFTVYNFINFWDIKNLSGGFVLMLNLNTFTKRLRISSRYVCYKVCTKVVVTRWFC